MEALQLSESPKNEAYYHSMGMSLQKISYIVTKEQKKDLRIQRDLENDEINALKKELHGYKKMYERKIKLVEERIQPITKGIETGIMETEIYARLEPNYSTGQMEYYDEEGVLVYQRELKPSERQMSIIKSFNI